MVKDSRITEYSFGTITPTSGGGHVLYSEYSINGELLAIEWKANTTGSVGLYISGTMEQLFYKKDLSGTVATIIYPMVYGVTNANVTGSPSMITTMVMNNKVMFSGTGFEGGSISYLNLKYR